MKTNKMIVAGLAASAIIMLSVGSASAMYGQGNGQGGGQGKGNMSQYITAEQKAEIQKMSKEERKEYIQKIRAENGLETRERGEGKKRGHGKDNKKGKDNHDMGDMIKDIEKQDVDAVEIDLLQKQYEEEMMANELYMSFYEMYGVKTFENIANSEAKHMEAVKVLLDRYEIDVPTSYAHIQSLYDDLKAKGALSLKDALEVGVSIEKVDIDDIVTAIKSTDNDDIKTVFVNIGGGSYNHMRGFVKALANNDFTTEIDYSQYYDENNSTGNIKVRLAEKLEAEGVELPEGATSKAIKEKCNKEGNHGKKGGDNKQIKENKGKSKYSNRNNDRANPNKYANNSGLKAKYKSTYEVSYGSAIAKMNDSQLETLIGKIDVIIEKVNTGKYSDSVKEKYNSMLLALKEIAIDNVDEEKIFDGLFD